jgi:hypothetical protein
MMKALILAAALAAPAMAAPADEAAISIRDQSGSVSLSYSLRKDAGGLLCETRGVPKHHIRPKGLAGLKAPFRAELADKCERQITWTHAGRDTTACYAFGKNAALDEVLRWCTQL